MVGARDSTVPPGSRPVRRGAERKDDRRPEQVIRSYAATRFHEMVPVTPNRAR
jgi:hypothetical protein